MKKCNISYWFELYALFQTYCAGINASEGPNKHYNTEVKYGSTFYRIGTHSGEVQVV
jgi:hypothetical protein